jgi:hypothetical protein
VDARSSACNALLLRLFHRGIVIKNHISTSEYVQYYLNQTFDVFYLIVRREITSFHGYLSKCLLEVVIGYISHGFAGEPTTILLQVHLERLLPRRHITILLMSFLEDGAFTPNSCSALHRHAFEVLYVPCLLP